MQTRKTYLFDIVEYNYFHNTYMIEDANRQSFLLLVSIGTIENTNTSRVLLIQYVYDRRRCIDSNGRLREKLNYKRDDFSLPIVD